jgi:hypothetical protein
MIPGFFSTPIRKIFAISVGNNTVDCGDKKGFDFQTLTSAYFKDLRYGTTHYKHSVSLLTRIFKLFSVYCSLEILS